LGLVGSRNDNEESFSSERRGEKEKIFVPYVQLVRPIGGASLSGRQRQPVPVAEEELMKFSVLPEQHMNYSMTWFSLSAVTLGMASLALKKKKVPKL
jgi:cytochrome oxidase assembly protein ShyY1